MVTKLRSTSVSPYEIEMWDGPKTVVVKNPEGKIAYRVYNNEEGLKQGYYAAQENPSLFYENYKLFYERFKEMFSYGAPIIDESGISRSEVEAILVNVGHDHYWRKDDTCRCGLAKEG